MSAIYGISGLVDGFVQGRNVRNGWDDRKDDKARQKRMDDLTFTQDARSAEEHKRRMTVYDENASDWNRNRADNDAVRKISEDGKAAYDEGQQQPPQPADTSVSSSGPPAAPPNPVAGVAANLGIPMGAVPDRFSESMPTPEALMEKYATDPAPVRSDRAEAGNSGPTAQRFQSERSEAGNLGPRQKVAVRAEASGNAGSMAGASGVVPMGAMEPEFIALPPQSRAIEDELAASGNVGPRYIPNPKYQPPAPPAAVAQPFQRNAPGGDPRSKSAGPALPEGYGAVDYDHQYGFRGDGLLSDIQAGSRQTLAGINKIAPENYSPDMSTFKAVTDAGNKVGAYVMGEKPPTIPLKDGLAGLSDTYQANFPDGQSPRVAPMPAPAGTAPPAQSEGMGIGPRVGKASPAPDSAIVAAADAALATTSPATQEALQAAAVKAGPMGVNPTEKAGAEHAEKFAVSFNDYYLKEVAPKVMEEYLRQGNIEKATGFQEFIDRKETRAGMENWVKAAHAITLGDYDKFAENMLEAYNRLDYFPDGTTIVKEQSGITYGKDGEPNGARVTFRDEASGDTWEKVYGSVDDMVKEGMTLLAPEVAFEHYAAQNEATKFKPVDPVAAQKDLDKRVDDAAKSIFEKSIGLDGQPTIPYDEARKQAEAAISGGQGQQQLQGPPAPPPVAYRPPGA
ncbi:hypothetical protein [Cypionkella sp.]|uniref:hypothetical protein n=1 Tax=Cypionkella sp. TaxID=2811411 RepID=UPI002715E75E|nr:hypothetical protein [Cypionkella sp.]MDO8983010.1 hypothetical protein [Cypionkella sp.]